MQEISSVPAPVPGSVCISWQTGFTLIRAWENLSLAQHLLKKEYLANSTVSPERIIWLLEGDGKNGNWMMKELHSSGHMEGKDTGRRIAEREIIRNVP